MLCGVIKGPTLEKIHDQLNIASSYCHLAEMRLDYFESFDLDLLKKLRTTYPIPMIFTLRPVSQGGNYKGTEEERLQKIKILAALKPEYIDLEYTVPSSFIEQIKDSKVILSYHDFNAMPDPETILKQMKKVKADIYKMAFMLKATAEGLILLQFMRAHAENVIAMGMGPYSESTRILAPIFGAKFVYGSIDEESSTAPGQIPIKVLRDTYHYNHLKASTNVYGLIGDPVDKSLGHLCHNAVMHELKLNAVYVKFLVPKAHLDGFITEAKNAAIKGLSVTMPLKEQIIPNEAVNTLVFEDGKIIGHNTDGNGALDAIEEKMKVKGKKIIIIGAGGASKAIEVEAMNRGAKVTILRRNQEISGSYDILINATPDPMPIPAESILPNTIAMDIKTVPMETLFLQQAKEKNCTVIHGYEMFINQALGQFKIWFENYRDLNLVKKIIQKSVIEGINHG